MANKYMKYGTKRRNPDPAQAALLVIDMQEWFRDIAKPILPTVQEMMESARKKGIPIVYTQHCHRGSEDEGMLGEWWGEGDIIKYGSPEAELLPELKFLPEDKHIFKNVYSAFTNSDLESYLKATGRSEVIVTGVVTNLCCETTARDAFCRGFRVFFSTDGTGATDEEYHVATMRNMGYGFAYLITKDALAS